MKMKLLLQFALVFLLVPALCQGDGSILRKIGQIENLFELVKTKYDEAKTEMTNLSLQLLDAPDGDDTGPGRSLKDCADPVYKTLASGVRVIKPDGQTPITVYCDQDTDNGGWTVFQRRKDGSVDFYRTFAEYQDGFGDLNGEFWLGLDDLHLLTSSGRYELRVDMSMWNGTRGVANYNSFNVDGSSNNYRLHLGSFLGGNAGDSFSSQNNMMFSTKDYDNDVWPEACAQSFHGGYWYDACHANNLNGLYHHGGTSPFGVGINWHSFTGYYYSLNTVAMKIRPVAEE